MVPTSPTDNTGFLTARPGDLAPQVNLQVARRATCDACPHQSHAVCRLDGRPVESRVLDPLAICLDNRWPAQAQTTVQTPRTDLRVVIAWPWLGMGGAERVHIALAKWLPIVSRDLGLPRVIRVTDLVAAHRLDEITLAEMGSLCNVSWLGPDAQHTSATRAIFSRADVVLTGGWREYAQLLSPFSGQAVFLAHGSCELTTEISRTAAETGRINHWVAVSHGSRDVLYPPIRSQVRVIENGADIERVTPLLGRDSIRKKWGVQPHQRVILYAGRIDPLKRCTAVAEAVANLPEQYVGVLVGNDPQGYAWRQCEAIAPGRVIAGGRYHQIGEVLAGADVWLNCSQSEGFCLARIEASLARVPVVSTPTGDLPRLQAEHGQLAWLVPPAATGQQIADTILRLESTPDDQRQAILDRSYHLSAVRYTASSMAARWCQFLGTLS